MFNKKKTNKIEYSRYIASWGNVVGFTDISKVRKFESWLKSLGLSDDEVIDISRLATCGKMELEHDIEKFIAENN